MKDLRIVSIVMMLIGVLLFTLSAIFRLFNWPNMFHGIYVGAIIFAIGVTLAAIRIVIMSNRMN